MTKSLTSIYNDKYLSVPFLVNSHTFLQLDNFEEHRNLYTKEVHPNPKFSGKTIFETLQEYDPYFVEQYNKSFTFDGDTIEFITQNFYKTTVNKVIDELKTLKTTFISKVQQFFNDKNIFSDYGQINIARNNYGLAIFHTNSNNISIFNNMTYHINLTLPTQLNS